MLRLAPAGAWILALAATLACGTLACATLACGGPPPPPPSKLSEAVSPIQAPPRPTPIVESPFRPPSKEPPLPRSEPQLAPAELAAALASAEESRKIGDEVSAAATLRSCANKIPQHVRCEGELAILLARQPRFKYEADYYLDQVVNASADPAAASPGPDSKPAGPDSKPASPGPDSKPASPGPADPAADPGLDATYYRRLAEALRDKGRFADAAAAYQRMIDRSAAPSAADYEQLAVALQGVPGRLHEPAEALRRAYELDPTRIEWVREQAILLGQTLDQLPRAIELFEQYKTRTKDPEMLADSDRRIGELKDLIARQTPTPADPGASAQTSKRKNKAKKKPATGSK